MKVERLTRNDFDAQRSARRLHGAFFSLSVIALPAGMPPKVACVVAKKSVHAAVDRNLLKRRCRETVRAYLQRSPASFMLAFYAKKAAGTASFAELRADIEKLLSTALR